MLSDFGHYLLYYVCNWVHFTVVGGDFRGWEATEIMIQVRSVSQSYLTIITTCINSVFAFVGRMYGRIA